VIVAIIIADTNPCCCSSCGGGGGQRLIGIVDALILAGAFDMCCMAKLVPSTAPLVKAVSVLPLLRKQSCDNDRLTIDRLTMTRETSRDTSTDTSNASEVVLFEQGRGSRG